MTPIDLFLCIFLILLSSFLSASEVALFSLSRFQMRRLREHFRLAYFRIKRILSDPPGLLLTILIANEIVNVTFSTIVANSIVKS